MWALLALPGASLQRPPDTSHQEPALTDPEQWISFFDAAASLRGPDEPLLLNGRLSGLRQASMQELIGLAEREAARVAVIARECREAVRALERASAGVTLRARIEAIDDAGADAPAAARFAAFMQARKEIASGHVRGLLRALGSPRFQLVERYVRTRPDREFFPLVTK